MVMIARHTVSVKTMNAMMGIHVLTIIAETTRCMRTNYPQIYVCMTKSQDAAMIILSAGLALFACQTNARQKTVANASIVMIAQENVKNMNVAQPQIVVTANTAILRHINANIMNVVLILIVDIVNTVKTIYAINTNAVLILIADMMKSVSTINVLNLHAQNVNILIFIPVTNMNAVLILIADIVNTVKTIYAINTNAAPQQIAIISNVMIIINARLQSVMIAMFYAKENVIQKTLVSAVLIYGAKVETVVAVGTVAMMNTVLLNMSVKNLTAVSVKQ